MARECLSTPLNENQGEVVDTSNLPPWDAQSSGGEPDTPVSTDKPAAEPGYHNPSPLVWLTGHANEATVVVEGGDDGTGGYQIPSLHSNKRVLFRIWAKNSTGWFVAP